MILKFLLSLFFSFSLFVNFHRYRNLYGYFLIFFLSFLLLINRGNPDYDNYIEIFENPELYAEPGYSLFVNLIKIFGINHHNGIITIFSFFLFFTLFYFKKLSNFIYIFCILYFIFPFTSDLIQIRNLVSMLLFLYAIIFLSYKKHLLCLIALIVGLSFHYIVAIYIFLLFFAYYFHSIKNIYLITLLGFITTTIISSSIVNFLSSDIQIRNLNSYLNEDKSKIHSFLIWALPTVYYSLSQRRFSLILNKDNSDFRTTFNNLCTTITFASLILTPLLFFVDEFARVYRTVIVINYLFISINYHAFVRNYAFRKYFVITLLVSFLLSIPYDYNIGVDNLFLYENFIYKLFS
jgi:hypothetical protein